VRRRGPEVHGGAGAHAQPASRRLQRRAQDGTTQELEHYRSMVTASRDLMGFVDSTFTYRAVNQAYCDEHRCTEADILEHTVAEVMGDEIFEETLRPQFERCLAGEEVSFGFWWDSPSRGRRHVDARCDPFFEPDGSVSGIVMDVRDTTERKQIEERLKESVQQLELANQELERFSDALAHDLRNPLLVVTNFSHLLSEALGDDLDEEHREDLERVLSAGRHMVHMIDDLRDLTDVNRSEISRVEIDLSALGEKIIEDLRVLVPRRDVKFEAVPGITVSGDETLITILLTNLLQNAWKYTGRRRDAWIELGVIDGEEGVPIYHVRDNGIGFDSGDSERIFKAFERLHKRTEFSGSGLGLATVDRIVQRHGGRVWAEGIPEEGAVFRFTLASTPVEARGAERRHATR
jgi:PAS domain S-box-containing protein